MVLDLGWDVIKDDVGWAGAAQRAARQRQNVESRMWLSMPASWSLAPTNSIRRLLHYSALSFTSTLPNGMPRQARRDLMRDLVLLAQEGVVCAANARCSRCPSRTAT